MWLKLFDKLADRGNWILPLSLFFITVISRIPFASKYFYYSDSVQYALALDNYNITLHQPHPPGYFLYVMLGRIPYLFIKDANIVFISLSILFSALTVITIFFLGREVFNTKCAFLASILAITSPNLWFHGEIALNYPIEAFFSTFIAYLVWKIHKNNDNLIWLLAVSLALAGGFRQNTPIFLAPLCWFCLWKVNPLKIIASFVVFLTVSLCWFLPMLWMTGGWDTYIAAFNELWLFSNSGSSVFERGWPALKLYSLSIFYFINLGLGGGIVILFFGIYHYIRNNRLKFIDKSKLLFFSLWILPALLFYILIIIHPSVPGYALIILPPLYIVVAHNTIYISDELLKVTKLNFTIILTVTLVIINIYMFFFSSSPYTSRGIRDNDNNLKVILTHFESYNPASTALFLPSFMFYGSRHVMYYLSEFVVYDPNVKIASTGEIRKFFGGQYRRTILSDRVILPVNINRFAALITEGEKQYVDGLEEVSIRDLLPGLWIVDGSIEECLPTT
jgi:hypothetical protein